MGSRWRSWPTRPQRRDIREFGYAEVRAHGHTALLKDIQDFHTPEGHGMLKVWMSHGDKMISFPSLT